MLLAVWRIWTALDEIPRVALLPDPYEVEVASVADLWEHLDALREEYQECAVGLSDAGRALQMMLVIGEPDGERWSD